MENVFPLVTPYYRIFFMVYPIVDFLIFKTYAKTKLNIYVYIYLHIYIHILMYVFVLESQCGP